MKTRLTTSLIALSTVLGAPAFADVSAADVWSNQQAYYGAMGVTLNGSVENGVIANPEININLPMGIASLQVKTSDVAMVDNGDGSVTITYPSPMKITLAGSANNGVSFTGDMVMTHDEYTIIATGEPGDVSYDINTQNMRIDLGDFAVNDPDMPSTAVEGYVNLASWVGTAQVTEGNVITRTSSFETGLTDVDIMIGIENITSSSKQTTQPVVTIGSISLPAGGTHIMNLSAALRNGLSIAFEAQGGASQSFGETLLNGELLNRQETTTGDQTATVSFGESGLVVDTEADGFTMVMNDPMIFPGDLEFAMGIASMALDLPLNASADPQDFRIATSLQGITMADTIWNLFDPAGVLPRDPAEVSFDITGNGTTGTDFLDFMALAAIQQPDVEISDLTIENLRITAAGADATASGAMTFDWTDFQTIPGIPRPEGQVLVNLNGANALLDNLSAMGLIPEQDLMMPRMMMGMFATPVGDDQLESVLEVNSQGHVLANGQRLQ